MPHNDDPILISQVLNGHTAAFSILVDRYKDLVYTIALKILRNHEDAEETAMDAFLKAFQALKTFKGNARFSTWLYRIVFNTAISKTRQKREFFSHIDNFQPYEAISEESPFADLHTVNVDEQVEVMEKAMKKLDDDESLLLEMYYRHDCSVEDISSVTGLTISNVKVKLFRTRKKLLLLMNAQTNNSNKINSAAGSKSRVETMDYQGKE